MALVISEVTEELGTIREDIKRTETELKTTVEKKKQAEIKKELERFRVECTSEVRSFKKFALNTEDYKQGKVYFWKDGKPETQHKSKGNRKQRQRPRHDRQQRKNRTWFSSSSFDSFSDASGQSEREAPFLGYSQIRPQLRPRHWRRDAPPSASNAEGANASARWRFPPQNNRRIR